MEKMTLEDIKRSDADFLTPEEVSGVIGCQAFSLNTQAKEDITKLGFPCCLIGTRLRIPRLGFLKWMGAV